MTRFGQVEALPRIEVNVCFRALISESGLADSCQFAPLPDLNNASGLRSRGR